MTSQDCLRDCLTEKVYNVAGSQLVVKMPGLQSKGARHGKGLVPPRPLQTEHGKPNLQLPKIHLPPSSEGCEHLLHDPELSTDDFLSRSGDVDNVISSNSYSSCEPGTSTPIKGPVLDENCNIAKWTENESFSDSESKSVSDSTQNNKDKHFSVTDSTCSGHGEFSQSFERSKLGHSESNSMDRHSDLSASSDSGIQRILRKVLPFNNSVSHGQEKGVPRQRKSSGGSAEFPNERVSKSRGGDPQKDDKDGKDNRRAVLEELEVVEQIAFNLSSYQYLHPEIICMCDSLKKHEKAFERFFPIRSRKIFKTFKVKRKDPRINPDIVRHLDVSGMLPDKHAKVETIAELCNTSTSTVEDALKEAVSLGLGSQSNDNGLTSMKNLERSLAEIYNESADFLKDSLVKAVQKTSAGSQMTPFDKAMNSERGSDGRRPQSPPPIQDVGRSKKVTFTVGPKPESDQHQPVHTIGIAPLRKPGDRSGMPYNPPVTLNLDKKLKMLKMYPPPMLESFLKDCTDPVTAVNHLVTCLETEARFVNVTINSATQHWAACKCVCHIGHYSFRVGYGSDHETARYEAALNVLSEVLNMPRETFVKRTTDQIVSSKDDGTGILPIAKPAACSNVANPDTNKKESWQPPHPPPPTRVVSPTKSAPKTELRTKKPSSMMSLTKKLHFVMKYPPPALEECLKDMSDPVGAVNHLADCLEMKPKYMNDCIEGNGKDEEHSCICCIGNLAYAPGYGPNLETAQMEAAISALNEILKVNIQKK